MKEGYYWYRTTGEWKICWVWGGYVHFFGEVGQKIGNDYLTKYVEFGDQIIPPEK